MTTTTKRYDDGFDVGDAVSESWGYDQTNVDYYRVIRRTAASVWLRPMTAETVEGSEGFMSSQVRPGDDVPASMTTRDLYRNTAVEYEGNTWRVEEVAYHSWDDRRTVTLHRYDDEGLRTASVDSAEADEWTIPVPVYMRRLRHYDDDGGHHVYTSVNGHGSCSPAKGSTYSSWYA